MLRTTLATLTALVLGAGALMAAEPQGKKADQPFPATIVKMDAAKHVLIVKSKTPAGKEVVENLPIQDGVQLPNVQPGKTFTVIEKGGKVVGLRPIPDKTAVVKATTIQQPKPNPAAPPKTVAVAPPAKPPAKAVVATAPQEPAGKAAFAKVVAIRLAELRLDFAKNFLAKANQNKVTAQRAEKKTAVAYQTATANLKKAKAGAARAAQEAQQAFRIAQAKAAAARKASVKVTRARIAVAKAAQAKSFVAQLRKTAEAQVKAAVQHLNQAKAFLTKAAQQKVMPEKTVKKVVTEKTAKAVAH